MLFYVFVTILGYLVGILGLYLFKKAQNTVISILGGTLALAGSALVSLGITIIIYFQLILPHLGG